MINISDINLKVIHVLDLQIEDCYFLLIRRDSRFYCYYCNVTWKYVCIYILLHLLEPHQKKMQQECKKQEQRGIRVKEVITVTTTIATTT